MHIEAKAGNSAGPARNKSGNDSDAARRLPTLRIDYPATLRLALLLGLLASGIRPAAAKTWYVDADGRRHSSPVIAALLTSPTATLLNGSGANAGWHVCDRRIDYASALVVEGKVNLVLTDRCDMRVTGPVDKAAIRIVGAASSLTIWAQSADSSGPSTKGSITVKGGDRSAGIGGSPAGHSIAINGGTVNATGGNSGLIPSGQGYFSRIAGAAADDGECCAGIDGVAVTIRGGAVNAAGGFGSAGIGGGPLETAAPVTIGGGVVSATGGGEGAGIGGGYGNEGGTVIIHGGTVKAVGGDQGAGIGGGANGAGGTVTIDGGTVSASGGNGSAGIGLGDVSGRGYGHSLGGTIIIAGGKVTANGGKGGSGIGYGVRYTDGGAISIHGGIVIATGSESGAGIGSDGGYYATNVIAIDGGTVSATGGTTGAGIGGAPGADSIRISGKAKILANGGDGFDVYGKGAAIGYMGSGGYTSGAGISPIQRPADATVAKGGSAMFRVTVATSGTETANSPGLPYQWLESPDGGISWPTAARQFSQPGIAYQWQQSSDSGETWLPIAAATRATLSLSAINAAMNGNLYRCKVTISQQAGNRTRESFILYVTDSALLTVQ